MTLQELYITLETYIEEGYEDVEVYVRTDAPSTGRIIGIDISGSGVILYPEESYEDTDI